MAEYIERESLINFLSETRKKLPHDSKDFFTRDEMLLNFEQFVNLMPIFSSEIDDVVKVVRCKDCKFHREAHYEDEGEPPYIKHVCELYKRTMQLYDFCSYGERKETDNVKV